MLVCFNFLKLFKPEIISWVLLQNIKKFKLHILVQCCILYTKLQIMLISTYNIDLNNEGIYKHIQSDGNQSILEFEIL